MTTTTTKTRESEIANIKRMLDDNMISLEQAMEATAKINAKYDVAGGTQPPTNATTAAKAASPPQPRKSALEAMADEEAPDGGSVAEPEPVTPWPIMPLPAPLTKAGRIDRANLNEINIRAVEGGESKMVPTGEKDDKGKEIKKKKWEGSGEPTGVLAVDIGNQWKALYMTPKQLDQFITAFTAVDEEGENIMRKRLAAILATSQPQKIELL